MTSPDFDGIRLFGVEDGSFDAFNREKKTNAILCGVVTSGNKILDVCQEKIEVDGFDATEKLLKMLDGINVDAVVLGGITFAGFNIIDPRVINEETGSPVIIYSGVKPDNESMLKALKKHFNDWEQRWEIIASLGSIHQIQTSEDESEVYFEVVGCEPEWAKEVLKISAIVCRIPEPVRAARLIAKGLSQTS